jgi:hypothetical protein
LSDAAEEVGLVEFLGFLVEAASGFEVGELEAATVGFYALAKDFEGPPGFDYFGKSFEEFIFGIVAVLGGELLPFLGLGGLDKVEDILGDEAK